MTEPSSEPMKVKDFSDLFRKIESGEVERLSANTDEMITYFQERKAEGDAMASFSHSLSSAFKLHKESLTEFYAKAEKLTGDDLEEGLNEFNGLIMQHVIHLVTIFHEHRKSVELLLNAPSFRVKGV